MLRRVGWAERNLPAASHGKHGRAGGLAVLQVAVSLRGVAQWVALVDLDLDGALQHDVEELAGGGQQILARGGVGVERRAGQEQRALAGEDADIDRADRPGRLTERGEKAERRDAV